MVNHLYPHQRLGVDWLAATRRGGLFDEQGLGKTITAIVAADKIKAKRILVVAPLVVALNWQREIARWSPSSTVQVVTADTSRVLSNMRWLIVPHSMLIKSRVFNQLFEQGEFELLILDESQAFKNPKAQRTRAVYPLGVQKNRKCLLQICDRCWLLTGTPMPNNPSELWTMLYGLAPHRVLIEGTNRPMNWFQFRQRFCVIEPSYHNPLGTVKGTRNVEELKRRLAGFSMRRLKRDHLDLPPIRWGTVTLAGEISDELREIEAQFDSMRIRPTAAFREAGVTAIKHGSQTFTMDELDVAFGDLAKLRDTVEFSTWRRLCGIAKAPSVVELLQGELEETEHKVVVFAHHKEVIETIRAGLAQFGVVTITGSQDAAARQKAVDDFQTDGRVRVAICNLVAGGVGITLHAASEAVFAETSFVPGEIDQAACRIHRIGQKLPCAVRILSLAGSVDELVAEIVARKAQMIRQVVG